jgi:thiamine pyrophosphate-dependent acetolactate synthase large subunit-like protein
LEEKKKVLNGGDVLIKCLLEEDIKYLFGIIGGQFLNIPGSVLERLVRAQLNSSQALVRHGAIICR